MTLLELCEPLFQYICRLNRSKRIGPGLDYQTVRDEIRALFDRMVSDSAAHPGLSDQFKRVESPLIYFVDSILAESDLSFAHTWHENRLAFDKDERAGDERFYDLLDETLADPGEPARERLTVFYVCIGLGFRGWFKGQSDALLDKMRVVRGRIGSSQTRNATDRICPDAYQNVDTQNRIEPPAIKLVGIVIALVGLIVVLFVTNIHLYSESLREIQETLGRITDHGKMPP